MAIIDHGTWERYAPNPPRQDWPANVIYARRVGGGEDWYDYLDSKPFKDGSVIMTVLHTVIQAATRDPSAIFPPPCNVIEETEYAGTDPQKDFGRHVYNADLRKIGELYVPAS
jgi:hypothetical protein